MFGSLLTKIYLPEEYATRDFDLLEEANKRQLEVRNSDVPTENDRYRVSALPHLCARQEVLRAQHRVPRTLKFSPKQKRTFDFGHAFNNLVRDEWFGRWGWLLGDWTCRKCGMVYRNTTRPAQCSLRGRNPLLPHNACGGLDFNYGEEELVNEQYGIVGHPDGVILLNDVKKVLELKTANHYHYKQVTEYTKSAIDWHKDQANLYMWLTGIKRAVIVYINKDSSDWAQYPHEYEQHRTEKYIQKVQSIRHGIKTGELPGRVCEKSDCARAKSCPVQKQCFGL